MSFGVGIADAAFITEILGKFISANSDATLNYAELHSECEFLKLNLEAAEEHCASQQLSGIQKRNVEVTLERCNGTLARLKAFLNRGHSLKSGFPSVRAILRFSNTELTEWKDKIRTERINLIMIFSMNARALNARVEDKVDLLASMVVNMWSQMQVSSTVSIHTLDSLSTNSRGRWIEIRRSLERKGVSPEVFNQYEDQILLQVEEIISSNPEPESGQRQEETFRNHFTIRTALLEATAQGSWGEVKKLLDDNPRLDIKTPEARLAFSLAVTQGAWGIVRTLVDMGMDPNGTSADRQPAICVAASSRAWDIVKFLAKRQANLNATDSTNHTAALRAASHRMWELVLLLARQGANVRQMAVQSVLDTRPDKPLSRISVLSYAATYGDWNRLEPLLIKGAHPDSESLGGNPIITVAASSKCWYAVSLLVEYKANVNAKDRVGRRALSYALTSLLAQWPRPTEEEQLEIARVAARLLSVGAEVGEEELKALSLCPWPPEARQRALTPHATADDLIALLVPLSPSIEY